MPTAAGPSLPTPPEISSRGASSRARGRGRGRGGGNGRGRRRQRNRPRQNQDSSSSARTSPNTSHGSIPDIPAPTENPHIPPRGRGRGPNRRSTFHNRTTRSTHLTKLNLAQISIESPTELSDRLSTQVARGAVECVVCLDRIRREAPTWHCNVCYTLTHLHCARKWGNQAAQQPGTSPPTTFNCPSCRTPSGNPKSIRFRCFCGRRKNPQLEPGILPGSCGDPCLKPKGADGSGCTHKCTSLCHPGPCASCVIQAPPVQCHCGKEMIFRKCGEPKPIEGVSCGKVCGKIRDQCGHACEKVCHPNNEGRGCGECETIVNVTCFCGGSTTALPCSVASEKYSCGGVCGRMLECNNHRCERPCHAGECGPCATSVSTVNSCPCGKQQLSSTAKGQRKSCTDAIPSCGGICGKDIGCLAGHKCQSTCGHYGKCPPCTQEVMVECRCATTVLKVVCGEKTDILRERLLCGKKCNESLLCRRHRCQTVCCLFKKRKALPRPNVISSENVWLDTLDTPHRQGLTNAERRRIGHGCNEICGKQLSCGIHECDLACGHNGECPPCGILSRDPLFCACRSVAISPPVRCGTPLPSCGKMCSVVRDCGHQCPLYCHQGECPPCAENMLFECVGGHGEGRFVPCHIGSKGIKCSRACGRALRCDVHACRNPCHGDFPAECEPSTAEGCSQPCGLARKKCPHACKSKCHPGMLCPDTPCRELLVVSCPCGRRQEKAECLRGGMGGSHESGDHVRLPCDEECAAQHRLRGFAKAVGKDAGSQSEATGPAPTRYSEFLLQFAERETGMLAFFEREFAKIVSGRVKKFVLDDLPQLHRLVVHTLADEYYRLESESSGRPSSRQLVVRHRGAGVKPVLPKPLLSEALLAREQEKRKVRQLESGKTLVIHVAGSTRFPATATIEVRAESELRAHTGCYRILERTTMSSNLIGVSVEFSTSERALLARNSLMTRPDVAVEMPLQSLEAEIVATRGRPQTSEDRSFAAMDGPSWNEGTEVGRRDLTNGLPAPPPISANDEDVPDSWDD